MVQYGTSNQRENIMTSDRKYLELKAMTAEETAMDELAKASSRLAAHCRRYPDILSASTRVQATRQRYEGELAAASTALDETRAYYATALDAQDEAPAPATPTPPAADRKARRNARRREARQAKQEDTIKKGLARQAIRRAAKVLGEDATADQELIDARHRAAVAELALKDYQREAARKEREDAASAAAAQEVREANDRLRHQNAVIEGGTTIPLYQTIAAGRAAQLAAAERKAMEAKLAELKANLQRLKGYADRHCNTSVFTTTRIVGMMTYINELEGKLAR